MEKKEQPPPGPRQKLIDTIHDTIDQDNIPIPDIILALAQVMTDIGLTLWNHRFDQADHTNHINAQLLTTMEAEHYKQPMLDTALSLTASQMICWVQDDQQVNQ